MNIEYTKQGIVVNGVEILLADIINKVNELLIKETELCLLNLEWGSHRGFDGIYETRVMTLENANKFKDTMIGYEVYFGEIAGKHSDIYGTIDEEDIGIVTNIEEVKDFLRDYPEGEDYNFSFVDRICDQLPEDAEEDEYGNEAPMSYSEFIKLFEY